MPDKVRPQGSARAVLQDAAADETLLNARDLHTEAALLAGTGHYARARALELTAAQDIGKAFLWRLLACGALVETRAAGSRRDRLIYYKDGLHRIDSRALNDHDLKAATLSSMLFGGLIADFSAMLTEEAAAGRFQESQVAEGIRQAVDGLVTESSPLIAVRLVELAAATEALEEIKVMIERLRRESLYVDVSGDQIRVPRSVTMSEWKRHERLVSMALERFGEGLSESMPEGFREFLLAQPWTEDEESELGDGLVILWLRWRTSRGGK